MRYNFDNNTKIKFGKHRGETYEKIYLEYYSYCNWIKENVITSFSGSADKKGSSEHFKEYIKTRNRCRLYTEIYIEKINRFMKEQNIYCEDTIADFMDDGFTYDDTMSVIKNYQLIRDFIINLPCHDRASLNKREYYSKEIEKLDLPIELLNDFIKWIIDMSFIDKDIYNNYVYIFEKKLEMGRKKEISNLRNNECFICFDKKNKNIVVCKGCRNYICYKCYILLDWKKCGICRKTY